MEFRGCSNFHYVQAIKDGVVSKVPNVFRSRPKLKLKNIQEVYEATDAKAIDWIAVVRPKIEDSSSESYRTTATGQSGPEGVKVEVDGGEAISEPDPCGGSDDHEFMTLREMKAKCKANKRKRRGFAVSSEGIAQTASSVKQESSTSPFKVDDDDLLEPLSHWKSRILMSKRNKRKVRSNSVFTSSQMNLSVVLYKGIQDDQQFVCQSNLDVFAHVPVKTEASEPPYTDHQGDDDWLYCGGIGSGEESEPASVWDWKSKMLSLSVEEGEETENCGLNTEDFFRNEFQCFFSGEGGCIGNEVLALTCSGSDGLVEVERELSPATSKPASAFGFVSNDEPENLNGTNLDCSVSSVACDEEPKPATDQFSETEVSTMADKEYEAGNDCGFHASQAIDEAQLCVLSVESYDHVVHPFCVSVLDAESSAQRNILVNVPEVILRHPSDSFVVPCPSNDSSQPDSSCTFHIPDNCKSLPSLFDELGDRPKSLLSDDRSQDGSFVESVPISVHDSVISGIPSTCSSPGNCLDSVSSNCQAVEKKALFTACVNEKGNSPTKIYPNADDLVTTIEADEVYLSKMQHPTQRLLSNRKIISPTSQKRLQKAMESAELDDEQYYKYARKMCYMKKMDNRIGGLEGHNQIKRTESTSSPKQLVKKETGSPYSLSRKGILKESSPSTAIPRITSSSSVQSCSESAVAFSQRQMRDIETLASKLTRELKCMKDIVEETFSSEVYAATPVKRMPDEVKVIIRNATRVEVGAKRWLTVMSRDCDRFCKIMKLTGKDPLAPANVLSKQKRKIIFADEAGGKLCDVRIFANNTNASVDSESG